MCRIFVTLDTEMDSDIHWVKKYPPEYTSITEGIVHLLRPIWNKYDVHPIYFVSPEVLYNEQCIQVLRAEINKGAVIGAHLHPEYIEPDSAWGEEMDKVKPQFPCYDCSDATEREKLKNLTDLIIQKLGVRPVWYRAARFGADMVTIRTLKELGYQFDSSVTPGINWMSKGGPDHSRGINVPYLISDDDMYHELSASEADDAVQEVPVTIYGKRWGILGRILPDHWLFYQWLRPTHMTYWEMKNIIRKMVREQKKIGVLMFHSMEIMINKTPYVRSRWMQKYYLWRLRKILQCAVENGYGL